MRINRIWLPVVLLLASQTLGGCVLFPELKDKIVDLVTGTSVKVSFPVNGLIDVYNDSKTINIRDSVDIGKVINDAGINISDVKSITVSGVAYRITQADTDPSRQINGAVQVAASGGPLTNLIDNFNAACGKKTGWNKVTLDPAGVTQLNHLCAAILAELQGGPAADEHLGYSVAGTSTPIGVNSDFAYEIRLTINIVGKVKVKTLQ
jgi:hypothetical protein